MKCWLGFGLLATTPLPLAAQEFHSTHSTIEAAVGAADIRESYTSDCCGPSRTLRGASASLRLARPLRDFAEIGVEGGLVLAGGTSMEWFMATGAVGGRKRLAPWLQVGAGALGHPGDCTLLTPATASAGSALGCGTNFGLGASAATGLRWRASGRVVIGLEGSFTA